MAGNDGTKRWAIAPPPPKSSASSTSGEFTLSLDSDVLDPKSRFMTRRAPGVERSSIVNKAAPTLSPEAPEPFDSDRPTDVPGQASDVDLSLDREFPTIPAPLWNEPETGGRPAPAVATHRGFFLESLADDEPRSGEARVPESTLPPVDFDSDDPL